MGLCLVLLVWLFLLVPYTTTKLNKSFSELSKKKCKMLTFQKLDDIHLRTLTEKPYDVMASQLRKYLEELQALAVETSYDWFFSSSHQ